MLILSKAAYNNYSKMLLPNDTLINDLISAIDDENDENIEAEVQSIHFTYAFTNPSIPNEIKDFSLATLSVN